LHDFWAGCAAYEHRDWPRLEPVAPASALVDVVIWMCCFAQMWTKYSLCDRLVNILLGRL
jgi:hypothetical protein